MEQQDRSSLMMRIEQAAVALLHGRPTRRSQGGIPTPPHLFLMRAAVECFCRILLRGVQSRIWGHRAAWGERE
jgi:hypothetical protein